MYKGMSLYRGVISYSDSKATYAYAPALTGSEVPLKLSNTFGTPIIPVGTQVILAVEDDKAYNVHVILKSSGGVSGGIDGGSA